MLVNKITRTFKTLKLKNPVKYWVGFILIYTRDINTVFILKSERDMQRSVKRLKEVQWIYNMGTW